METWLGPPTAGLSQPEVDEVVARLRAAAEATGKTYASFKELLADEPTPIYDALVADRRARGEVQAAVGVTSASSWVPA